MPRLERTTTSSDAYSLTPAGRATQLDKIYTGFVKVVYDRQFMGRLKVYIPELGGDPKDADQWFTVNYAAPFAGASSVYDNKSGATYADTQRSYGFWFVPPDLENEVLCCFVNGDPARGYWFACLYQQFMNHMVPGIPGQRQEEKVTEGLPVAEYNKIDPATRVVDPKRPIYDPLADALKEQGLDKDDQRGITTAGARRAAPASAINAANGILTPGGLQFVMDDNPDNKFIRLRTQHGAQVLINDNEGWIYMISRDGSTWFELGTRGDIQMYAQQDISIRGQGNLNLRGDKDVNIEAGGSIYMKARDEARTESLTYYGGQTDSGGPNPTSGQETTASSTNTAQVPAIGPQDTAASILVPKNNVTGAFTPGMLLSGILWTNPQVANPTTQPLNPTTIPEQPGQGNPVVVVGDGVALGAGQSLALQEQGTLISATSGLNSGQILQNIQQNPQTWYAQYAIISAGNSDLVSGQGVADSYANQAGLMTQNLSAIRATLSAQRYIWILPTNQAARDAVYGFATGFGDQVVDQGDINYQTGLPTSYDTIANSIRDYLPQINWPTQNVNTWNTDSTVNQEPPVTIGSIEDLGDLLRLNVNFPAGNTAQASNGSQLTGTSPGETTNNQPVQTPTNSTNGGMIMMKAAKDLHMVSGRDMYQRSVGQTSRVAQKNMFDYSYGSYDQACGGYMAIGSNGKMNIGSAANMVLGATRVDINGPSPQAPKAGASALEPIDTYLKDNEVLAASEFKFTVKNTILSVLPFHEPYDGHNSYTQGLNNYVEEGDAIDASSGLPLKDGQIASGQSIPLGLVGSPNGDSKPGNYSGSGYNDKGEPQFEYNGPSPNGAASAGGHRMSKAGLEFLIREEGSESTAYADIGRKRTIGVGHLLLPEENAGNYVLINGKQRPLNSPLSTGEIMALLQQDLRQREDTVNNKVKAAITQAQFDMLVSIVYNVGNCNSIAKQLNSGNFNISKLWMSFSYYKKNGVRTFSSALNKRRQREYAIFSNGYAYKG